jgi:hypothetical protein
VADRRYNAKLILPDGTEKPSLIVYFPPTLTDEEVEDIGRKIISVFSGQVLSDVEDEDGRGTTTEDMLDAGLLDSDGVKVHRAPLPIKELLAIYDEEKGDWCAIVREVERRHGIGTAGVRVPVEGQQP